MLDDTYPITKGELLDLTAMANAHDRHKIIEKVRSRNTHSTSDEHRRMIALAHAVTWAGAFKNGTPKPEQIISAAKQFELYIKGDQ